MTYFGYDIVEDSETDSKYRIVTTDETTQDE